MKEYIICSAAYWNDGKKREHQPKNIDMGIVVCGRRHHNCITTISEFKTSNSVRVIQGFLTNTDRFVDRSEAAVIAFKSGQVDKLKKKLFSEDLY